MRCHNFKTTKQPQWPQLSFGLAIQAHAFCRLAFGRLAWGCLIQKNCTPWCDITLHSITVFDHMPFLPSCQSQGSFSVKQSCIQSVVVKLHLVLDDSITPQHGTGQPWQSTLQPPESPSQGSALCCNLPKKVVVREHLGTGECQPWSVTSLFKQCCTTWEHLTWPSSNQTAAKISTCQ